MPFTSGTPGPAALIQLLGAAVTLGLLWAAGFLGPAGMVPAMLSPLPAAYVQLRRGPASGLGVVFLVAGTLWLIDGPGGGLLYLLQFGLASLILPRLLSRGQSWDRAIAATALIGTLLSVSLLFAYARYSDQAVEKVVSGYIQGELAKVDEFYQQAELTPTQAEELKALTAGTADYLLAAYPALILVANSALLLLVVILLARLSQGHYRIPGLPLSHWKAPESLIWGVILGGFGVFFADGLPRQVSVNLLTLLLPVYFLQGMAVVAHFFQRRGTAPFLRVLGYMMLVIVNPLPAVVTGIGIFDLWLDFRNPKEKKT